MKVKWIVGFLCALLMESAAGAVTLRDTEKGPKDRVNLGSMKRKDEIPDPYFGQIISQSVGFGGLNWGAGDSDLFANGDGWGVAYSMEYANRFAAEVSFEQIDTKSKSTPDLAEGKLQMRPITLAIRYYPMKSTVIRPFVLAGTAYYLFDLSTDDYERQLWADAGFTFSQKIESDFGYIYGAGVELFLVPNRFDLSIAYKRTEMTSVAVKTLNYPLFGFQFKLRSAVDLDSDITLVRATYHF